MYINRAMRMGLQYDNPPECHMVLITCNHFESYVIMITNTLPTGFHFLFHFDNLQLFLFHFDNLQLLLFHFDNLQPFWGLLIWVPSLSLKHNYTYGYDDLHRVKIRVIQLEWHHRQWLLRCSNEFQSIMYWSWKYRVKWLSTLCNL